MFKRMLKWITIKRAVIILLSMFGITAAAATALAGPHRALCPTCFGMVEAAPNIYTDTQDDALIEKTLIELEQSHKYIASYLGGRKSQPRILLCFENACERLFGKIGPRGVSWGKDLIRLNPKGLNPTIMRHELFHTELHARMGTIGLLRDTIPRWFNEGLAVHVSGDPRFDRNYTQEERSYARTIKKHSDFRREVNENTWKVIYGASAQIVKEIEGQIGRAGIIELIKKVTEDKQDFEQTLRDMLKENLLGSIAKETIKHDDLLLQNRAKALNVNQPILRL